MRIQQLSQMIAYAVRIVCAPFQAIGYLRGDLVVSDKSSLSYKDAGINIDAGNALVDRIKDVVKRTKRPEVIGGLGGFGALCALPQKYREPILVSGTDGVGTKLRLCIDLKRHDTIGIDLVAMCVNDLVVHGAEPLFFLDYYTTGKLDIDIAAAVISGIAEGCRQSGCTLVGGETAEMPGMYNGEDYDVAGFCVGVVEKANIIDGTTVQAGDMLLALDSSGPHSNGYSLVRKILTFSQTDPEQTLVDGKLLTDHLLAPTRIYVKALLSLIEQTEVHAIAHLTGGGFWENIPRVLPAGTQAVIDENSWKWPAVFRWLQQAGNVTRHEMYRTFNCGVGMVIAVPAGSASQALGILVDLGETAWVLGEIQLADGEGSNLQALIEGCQQGRIAGRIAAVISNRADAYGLMRAAAAGIETQSLNTGGFADRKAFDLALSTRIDRYQPEAILLAGYMRILSTAFVTRYLGRILNVHPSLLPRYPGLHTHRQALGNGDAEHGTSVHFVTDKMDEGPVVLQARVPVFAGDNQQILARRVKTQEHAIYPLVVGWLLTGRLTLRDNLAWLDGAPLPPAGYAPD